MRKKSLALTLMLAFSCILGGGDLMAYNFTDVYEGKTIYYSYVTSQYGTEVKVTYKDTDYNTYSGNIVIPTTATNSDLATPKTYNVTQIDANAFKNSTGLTSVTIASSITKIGSYAFQGCTSLTEITIPSNVTSFDNSATSMFAGCTNLVTVVNNSNTTSIQPSMFNGCSKLKNISIPAGITSFGYNCFKDCTSIDNVTYNATNCGNMTSSPFVVSTAESLNVIIGENVETIPNSLFYLVSNLKSIIIPNSVTSIGNNSFRGTGLTSLTIGNHVSNIGNYAFNSCGGLTSISLPSTLQTIGDYAFQNCSGLTSITIPSSVTSIGSNAFQSCTGITEINYNATNISDFTNSNKPFKACGSTDTEVTLTIGANVTTIPAYAFNGAKTVGTLVIPASVTSIGTKAFTNNGGIYTSVSTVYMLGTTPPSIAANDVFKIATYPLRYSTIKVLYSSDHSILTAYQEATNWSTFSSSISETTSVTIANMDLTNGSLTIPAGNTITVTGTLTNTDASHLVIEDGGQLIIPSSKTDVKATFQKEITGYEDTKDNYFLIANPTTGSINPTTVSGMLDNNYDLYYFDEAQSGAEWRNYKQEVFNLVNGKGYLYANSSNLTLEFPGTVPTGTTANITLSKSGSGDYAGFNLVGNPLSNNVTSMKIGESSCSYYKVNSSTGVFAVSTDPIIVGEAFMVEAPSNGATLQLNPSAKDEAGFTNEVIRLEVSNSKFTDVAYVYFGNHLPLTKINHLNDEAPMLYIHNEYSDKAVEVYNNRGEVKSINVNFEAKTIGTYTISAKMVKGEIKYMHLYDRFTGIDTDLLIDDYSFIGANEDQPGRFILKLEAIDNGFEGSDNFAYQSGNNIMVNGEGELQIFDVMGRKISTHQINGVETVNVNAHGVYIFKLNEKTQKIIIK